MSVKHSDGCSELNLISLRRENTCGADYSMSLREIISVVGRQSSSRDPGSETLIDATFVIDTLVVGKS